MTVRDEAKRRRIKNEAAVAVSCGLLGISIVANGVVLLGRLWQDVTIIWRLGFFSFWFAFATMALLLIEWRILREISGRAAAMLAILPIGTLLVSLAFPSGHIVDSARSPDGRYVVLSVEEPGILDGQISLHLVEHSQWSLGRHRRIACASNDDPSNAVAHVEWSDARHLTVETWGGRAISIPISAGREVSTHEEGMSGC